MNNTCLLKRLFGRILAPSYVSTVLWMLTDAVEVVILGVAVSAVLAVAAPFLETCSEALAEWRATRQAKHRGALLDAFVPFITAYKDVLTKYPPGLLPAPYAGSVDAQLACFVRFLQTLKGQRTQPYATPYDTVLALAVTQEDFHHWDLDACTAFVHQVTTDLSGLAVAALQQAVQRFAPRRSPSVWARHLQAAECELDQAVQSALAQWRVVQLARQDPEVQQRVTTLLRLEAVHRQAGLQTYLSAPRLQYPPDEVQETIAYLRYDPVADQVRTLLERIAPPNTR